MSCEEELEVIGCFVLELWISLREACATLERAISTARQNLPEMELSSKSRKALPSSTSTAFRSRHLLNACLS